MEYLGLAFRGGKQLVALQHTNVVYQKTDRNDKKKRDAENMRIVSTYSSDT